MRLEGKGRGRRTAAFGSTAVAVCASLSLASVLFSAVPSAYAQKGGDAEKVLVEKAKALEARGRPDIAVQVWQQILLSDPNNAQALEGVARDYRLSGNSAASDQALDKLRKINPGNPNINSIQGLTQNKTRDARLSQAGALSKAGNPEGAMRIYREYYGDHPPDGDIALAYYETLYATANGKQQAIAAMRAAAARNPGDPRFIVTLGRMLTYSAPTRPEGIRILREHQDNVDAQNALRQALVWDADNPASAAELREYLKTHNSDSDLQKRLEQNEAKLKEMNSGIARTPEEKAAFAALNAHKLTEAESRFQTLLEKDPTNARAAAGMGFLRMQQKNFADAISYLVQAEQNGFRDRSVIEGLATSRFWYTMSEASLSMDVNKLDVAAEKYRAALEMRPRSPEALSGLAGVYSKNQQYNDAATVYQQILRIQPGSPDAWRGLFLSTARAHDNRQALNLLQRMPAGIHANLNRDPEFLQTLAGLYQAEGRDGDAQKTLALALSLPFPDNGSDLKAGTRLQYAGILMQAKRYDQAAELYKQIINDDTSSLPAWMGLVTAEHQLQRDNEAIGYVEKMPPDTYQSALNDAGFLSMLGSMYAQSNQFEIAQTLLERAAKLQSPPALGVEIQLASIYLQRNDTTRAYDLYHQILEAHPDNLDAWRGLIGTLQLTHRDKEALEEIRLIPADIRRQLEADVQFQQSEASLYANAGDTTTAIALFNSIQRHYAAIRQQPPADVEIQSAYLLYNSFNDRELYNTLMHLGAREDLTNAQRETIQGLWANWSVRRSAAAFDAGNTARALEVLDAAAQAFPDNLAVRKAVAGGYLRAGKTKEALAIFKSVDFQDATASDFQGAIGAALAASDKSQAEIWLRQGLERYPNDPSILASAARFEQARGDSARAADYWRASLAAMPQVSATDRLAHDLNHPEAVKPNQRPATPNDLANLLNPDMPQTGAAKSRLAPLPAYGHDPYDPSAPVVLAPQKSNPPSPTAASPYQVPTTTALPVPQAELNTPAAAATSAAPLASPFRNSSAGQADSTASRIPLPPPPALPSGSRSSSNADPYSGVSRKTSHRGATGSSAKEGQMNLPARGNSGMSSKPSPASDTPANSQRKTVPVYPQLVPQGLPEPAPRKDSAETNRMQAQTEAAPSTGVAAPAAQRVDPAAYSGLRLSTEPLNPRAAQAQALFNGETDSQLNPGFSIHYLPNAGINLPPAIAPSQSAAVAAYSNAQYTPSAQDAAAGAYSAPKQAQPIQPPPIQSPQPESQVNPQAAPAQQASQPTSAKLGKHKRRKAAQPSGPTVPTLVTAPGETQQAAPQLPVADTAQPQGTQSTTTGGLTDQELEERNLPPLRGPWLRLSHKPPVQLSPRDEAEQQLRQIEGGYSAWLGGTGTIAHRTGNAGYDSLTTLESAFEASVPLSTHARLTFIAKPVFLDAGQADGTAIVTLTSGTVPEPFGTGAGTDGGTTDPSANPPAQQNAAGIGGEAQLTFGNLAIAGGYTPYGFQVSNWTARANWRPGAGPFTFTFNRDAVKDTQLSYAGLRDPFSATQVYPGNVWGGVMANAFGIQYARGDLNSGFYVGGGGQYLTGVHVEENRRIDGSMGAYFRVFADPERGSLNVGVNFFAMHYAKNLLGFTYGLGGYFSPQAYFLGNVPITWTGHRGTRWHYTVLGSFGVQAFSENKEPLFPLDSAIEIGYSNPSLPALTSVGANYDLRGQAAYAVSDHWFVGGFASANNSRDYTTGSAGFSVRYLFRSQPSTVAGPTGLFQTDDAHPLRPLTVP
jgi:tetratricopeptide (TPR) repeat protein